VTFLFTDIEGSTRLLEHLGNAAYTRLAADHHRILRAAAVAAGGYEVDTQGDSFFIAFARAEDALRAAADAQRALAAQSWPEDASVRVRMGIVTGEGNWVDAAGYVGLDVHRGARIAAAAHGGQVLVSNATREAVERSGSALVLRDLGHFRLKDLATSERVHQLVVSGLRTEFPPIRALPPPTSLPVQVTSFVGRTAELSELAELLSDGRLLTLVGPGGTGKTRLALEVVSRAVHAFRDGVYFVPLESVVDYRLVPAAVARALPIPEREKRDPREQVADFLADKQALLVLDNFEHVVGAARWVSELLTSAASTTVVVTSRAALRVYGEREYAVRPLAVPATVSSGVDSLGSFDAVRLFVERASAAVSSFTLATSDADAVARIVRVLDGLPLAIELAAARVKVLPPPALLARLESRLDTLQIGGHGRPTRHRTLRATIAWSYDLLRPGDRQAFARFGAFVGGAEADAAALVLGGSSMSQTDVLERLAILVEESLLARGERAGEPRFCMLQTIREFALERLRDGGEEEAVLDRHTAAFASLAAEAEPHLAGSEARKWLDRLELEHDNLAAALSRARSSEDTVTSLRFVGSLWRFWQMRGFLDEGQRHTTAALDMAGAADHPYEQARALEGAGGIAYWQADFDGARTYYQQALALQRQHGDERDIANALYNLSFTYSVTRDDMATARRHVEESLARYRRAQDHLGTAKALFALGNVAYFGGRFEEARDAYTRSLELARELSDPFSTEWALYMVGLTEQALGNVAASARLYGEAFQAFSAAGDMSGSVMCLNALADLSATAGDRERAATLAGAATALETRSGVTIASFAVRQEQRADLQQLRELAPAAWAEGERLAFENAVAYALEFSSGPT
jgi:predicted ATPase/class 3 adenylate cyclase